MTPQTPDRRSVLVWLSTAGMLAALAAAYGTLAGFMGRFLYPTDRATKGWLFVTQIGRLGVGESIRYHSPVGATVNVTRRGEGGAEADFIALSSVCPHLGCQVHWEAQNNRFFCPCHNGVFDPGGVATSGPPAEAKQTLAQYPLMVDKGLLFIQVPLSRAV